VSVIDDLDDTLAALLLDELPQDVARQLEVSFAAPDDRFPHAALKLPAIDLFLYDVRENLELRSNDVYLDRHADGSVTRSRAPPRVDFSYLITAWPGSGHDSVVKDEHTLLGHVMRVLLRHRTLPDKVLRGSLKGQMPALPVSSLQPGRLQSLGEFWQALGGKPKAALNYQVTLAVDVWTAEPVTLVTDKKIELHMRKALP
jgi:hypothetical protein